MATKLGVLVIHGMGSQDPVESVLSSSVNPVVTHNE